MHKISQRKGKEKSQKWLSSPSPTPPELCSSKAKGRAEQDRHWNVGKERDHLDLRCGSWWVMGDVCIKATAQEGWGGCLWRRVTWHRFESLSETSRMVQWEWEDYKVFILAGSWQEGHDVSEAQKDAEKVNKDRSIVWGCLSPRDIKRMSIQEGSLVWV